MKKREGNKNHREDEDRRLFRQGLLQAAQEELNDAQRETCPAPTPAHRQWEAAFRQSLKAAGGRESTGRLRQLLPRAGKLAACFLLTAALLVSGTLAFVPTARAAVAQALTGDLIDQAEVHLVDLTFQLGGDGGCDYACSPFACVPENGDVLLYSFKNTAQEAAVIQLYQRGALSGSSKMVGEALTAAPGETVLGTYANPGSEVYYFRINSEMGGSVSGVLQAAQVDS